MHNVQIRGHKDPTWVSFPYMVTDEEIDRLIVTWPPHWKLGFKSGTKEIVGTSTMKVTPPDTIKETGGKGKGIGKEVDPGS